MRDQVLAQEQRWAKPVAIVTLLAVVAFVASVIVGSSISGEGEAALLRSASEHSSDVILAGGIDAVAFLLMALPLVYLFRVVQARSDRMRGGMIVLVVAAPLFLAISTGLGIVAKENAIDKFLAGEAKSTLTKAEASKECASEQKDKGACERQEIEDDEASNAMGETSPASVAAFFGILGALSLIVGLFYTSLWAMRTGVLSRFWAALGMALGITVLLGVIFFLLIWVIYIGLVIGGWVPGGRPPAWAAGEAVPWPTPGEKAAKDLEQSGSDRDSLD